MTPVPDGILRPESPDAKLWRYMDFAKFVSLLDSKSLFFARSDRLGDPFEFTYPRANRDAFHGTGLEVNNDFFLHALRTFGPTMFMSCWQANEHESTGMWAEYLKGQQGVAVQTSFQRLFDVLATAPHSDSLDVGLVKYVNYETDRIHDQRIQSFLFHKRIQFAHEREFRAVYWLPDIEGDPLTVDPFTVRLSGTPRPCLLVPVNLDRLIEKVIVAPSAEPWFVNLVQSVSRKYKVDVPVVASSIARTPLR